MQGIKKKRKTHSIKDFFKKIIKKLARLKYSMYLCHRKVDYAVLSAYVNKIG